MRYRVVFAQLAPCFIEADSLEHAQTQARQMAASFKHTKLHAIYAPDYKEPPEPEPTFTPRGKPPSGSPAGGTARQEILVDQIAEAA